MRLLPGIYTQLSAAFELDGDCLRCTMDMQHLPLVHCRQLTSLLFGSVQSLCSTRQTMTSWATSLFRDIQALRLERFRRCATQAQFLKSQRGLNGPASRMNSGHRIKNYYGWILSGTPLSSLAIGTERGRRKMSMHGLKEHQNAMPLLRQAAARFTAVPVAWSSGTKAVANVVQRWSKVHTQTSCEWVCAPALLNAP